MVWSSGDLLLDGRCLKPPRELMSKKQPRFCICNFWKILFLNDLVANPQIHTLRRSKIYWGSQRMSGVTQHTFRPSKEFSSSSQQQQTTSLHNSLYSLYHLQLMAIDWKRLISRLFHLPLREIFGMGLLYDYIPVFPKQPEELPRSSVKSELPLWLHHHHHHHSVQG